MVMMVEPFAEFLLPPSSNSDSLSLSL